MKQRYEDKMEEKIVLSDLPKTWIFDLDGTIVKHNGYKTDGIDTLLMGVEEFMAKVVQGDMIIFLTSRTDQEKERTENFLKKHHIPYDAIIYNAPYGERILVNDRKPSGLRTAVAINTQRDIFLKNIFEIDKNL